MILTATALIRKNNNLLVLKKRNKPSHYILPGGKIDKGESPEEALIRELEEELSILIKKEQFSLFKIIETKAQFENDTIKSHIFLVDYQGDFKINNEIEEYAWIDIKNHDEKELAGLLRKLRNIL